MDALPDELVDYALSFLSLDRDGLDLDSLKHASLVHSRWTHAAQRYIWQAGAELLTPDDVDQFIKTAPRRTSGPRELAVHAHASMHQLTRLWDVCGDGDLKMLMIATPTRDVDPAVLVHPALKGSSRVSLSLLKPILVLTPPLLRLQDSSNSSCKAGSFVKNRLRSSTTRSGT